jgi:predicted Rdx family selenoprotein
MGHFAALAGAFIAGELLPTVAALATAAAVEPLTWAVLAAGVAGRIVWRHLNHLT